MLQDGWRLILRGFERRRSMETSVTSSVVEVLSYAYLSIFEELVGFTKHYTSSKPEELLITNGKTILHWKLETSLLVLRIGRLTSCPRSNLPSTLFAFRHVSYRSKTNYLMSLASLTTANSSYVPLSFR